MNSSVDILKEDLHKANETKDVIFQIISHDLRSPIYSLLGFLNSLDDFDIDQDLKLALGTIEPYLSSNARLVENQLEWSKSHIENAAPLVESIDGKDLVDQNFALLSLTASKKEITLINSLSEMDILHTDKGILDTALRNILQNAIKFTEAGGTVEVSFESNDNHTFIKVKDTGIGMTKEKLNDIFDIRANRSAMGTAGEKRSGLGLILCNELLTKINGIIKVSSDPGEGSTFQIIIKK
ncbi:MAG: two-component system sensor histidine kinase/response regulator [Cyclobacteriaceae bacterium]|jgi:two-component system sensor histidine kinase/response regulator